MSNQGNGGPVHVYVVVVILQIRSIIIPISCEIMFLLLELYTSFTCAGIIPRQYINFSTFSGIGTVGKQYITSGKIYDKYCVIIIVLNSVQVTGVY